MLIHLLLELVQQMIIAYYEFFATIWLVIRFLTGGMI